MYFNRLEARLGLIGILMMVAGVLVWKIVLLHGIVTTLFWPLTLGSSEAKAVVFLVLMGSLLFLNFLLSSGKSTNKFTTEDIDLSRKYLKYTLILILFTYAVGIIIEIWLRVQFGVSLFTVFVSLNPDVSTTSIIHTHVFKSVLGYSITALGAVFPSNIHTGDSLFKYVSPLGYIIILTLPLVYITSLIALDNRRELYKLIIAFAASLSLIGMVDGGIFSNPAMIGLAGLLGMYFLRKKFRARNLIKPTIIVLIVLLAGLSLEIGGSNPDHHEITIINQTQPVDMNGYNVLSTQNKDNRSIIDIKSSTNDKETLVSLFSTFRGKVDGFFITWNFYSYF